MKINLKPPSPYKKGVFVRNGWSQESFLVTSIKDCPFSKTCRESKDFDENIGTYISNPRYACDAKLLNILKVKDGETSENFKEVFATQQTVCCKAYKIISDLGEEKKE